MKKMLILKLIGFFVIFGLFLSGGLCYPQEIKKAEFAGLWYPGEPDELNLMIERLIGKADIDSIEGEVLGVICPHAGYIYSASVSAYSYKALQGKKFDTVVILAPSHRYDFEGVSVYASGYWQTPLGNLEIDSRTIDNFRPLNFVQFEPKYFSGEHSLEVQLPFIAKTMDNPKIIPVLFGNINYEQIEELAKKLLEISSQANILIIVSTDLSHFHPYQEAEKIDKDTIDLIKNKDTRNLWDSRDFGQGRACGIAPIVAFLQYARLKGADIKILKSANSGDITGDKGKVVGYLSAAALKPSEETRIDIETPTAGRDISVQHTIVIKCEIPDKIESVMTDKTEKNKEEDMGEYKLSKEEKITLLNIARSTLESYLKTGKIPDTSVDSETLKVNRGAFVTLKKKGDLRGCIGHIEADIPLGKVISEMAVSSAARDPRFPPVSYGELKDIEIEISVLTPFTKVEKLDEIEVGKHGLMIQKGFHAGLLLPQVPIEWGWNREEFLEQTCNKAGLAPDAYKSKDALLYKFSAIVFSESELKPN